MKKYLYGLILVLALVSFGIFLYVYQSPSVNKEFETEAADPGVSSFSQYFRARVVGVDENIEQVDEGLPYSNQFFKVQILDGEYRGQEFEIENSNALTSSQKVEVGDKIVVAELKTAGDSQLVYIDKYRIGSLIFVAALFLVLAIAFGRARGAAAVVGLSFSIFLLVYFVSPSIIDGKNAALVSLSAAGLMALVSIFLAHGLNERSALATVSTFITLLISGLIAYWFVDWANLFGLGTESAFYLQSGFLGTIDLKGLLFAGIIIGTLGILDDITTAQTAAVGEIYRANKSLGFRELFNRGSVIGREHIGSLINSLVLAYAGAAFPLFLMFTLIKNQPFWAVINSEFAAEEIVRALVGSMSLILAVPISCLVAAYYFSQYNKKDLSK